MNKEYIIEHWEQDWSDDNLYFQITESGTIQKYDVENNTMYEYQIDRVAH
jgi:hypothetical protein